MKAVEISPTTSLTSTVMEHHPQRRKAAIGLRSAMIVADAVDVPAVVVAEAVAVVDAVVLAAAAVVADAAAVAMVVTAAADGTSHGFSRI